MSIKDKINSDLKQAMLGGDKNLVTVLRGLKSVILYAEVAEGVRDKGLDDSKIIGLLQKESKKRQESADMYASANDEDRESAELAEKVVIDSYLPPKLSRADIEALVDETIAEVGKDRQKMGLIIKVVKEKSLGSADGAVIAEAVKERLI